MSAGRVGSQFGDGSDSTSRSCRSAVTRPISDRSSYSEVVTQPIFRSIRLQCPSDPTDWGSGLNRLDRFDIRLDIVTTNQCFWSGFITVVGDHVTGMLIAVRLLINCPLYEIMWRRIATVILLDEWCMLLYIAMAIQLPHVYKEGAAPTCVKTSQST